MISNTLKTSNEQIEKSLLKVSKEKILNQVLAKKQYLKDLRIFILKCTLHWKKSRNAIIAGVLHQDLHVCVS